VSKTRRYDWTACLIAVAAGLGTVVPLMVAADRLFASSSALLLAAITGVGIVVSRFVYGRLAKPGARPLSPE
jgi:uncharacterized membrane protein